MRRLGGPTPFAAKDIPAAGAPPETAGAPRYRRAWGFAVAYKNTGLGGGAPDRAGAEAELFPDGTVEVRTASAELGQGLPTVLQLIAAEELAIPPERVRILLSDTDLTPDGGPTTASRQTFVTGNAVRKAAAALRKLVTDRIAERPGSAGGTARVSVVYEAPETKPLGEGGDMHVGFSFAAQAAEVEVDTCTGEVRVLRLVTANDVGAVVNPLGLRAQMEGGAIMGLSHALTERFLLEEGKVMTDRFASYRMAPIAQTPEIISIPIEHPLRAGPFGAKGVGEIVTIPTPPAIVNALYNAVGVRVDRLPIDQEKVLSAILQGKAGRSSAVGR